MAAANVFTIGFTQSSADEFFERLLKNKVSKVIDVRLHNTSQLAGFAKATDLPYLLKKIGNIQFVHQPLLAPTDEMLKAYKTQKGDWAVYENRFLLLMADRKIEDRFKAEMFEGGSLLCSEAKPHHCHRRLVCDYLNQKWGGALAVKHL